MAISAAAKHGRTLLKEHFGKTVSRHIIHAPYSLRRSILFEMEKQFQQRFKETASHPFRHQEDLSIPSFLYGYYAYFTGRAIPAKLRYMYLDNTMHRFIRKAFFAPAGRYQAFCINGGHTRKHIPIRSRLLATLLRVCFPKKCEFEIC